MELKDRCRGLMVGLAVGNLLGIPCEGWPRDEIRFRWPDGLRDIEARAGYPDDDDLAQAVILAAASHGAESLDADDLARRFWVWGEENGLGMGNATAETLARYGGSYPRRGGGGGRGRPRPPAAPPAAGGAGGRRGAAAPPPRAGG
ncbi:MAG: ADP-ribosylglycohydrolase family protein, partial [Candidatus Tectomicrobia bacterium]|nr:ADP-ribosylglycohydrolase family protein [Candidatus Tectomicrobia bacterium]